MKNIILIRQPRKDFRSQISDVRIEKLAQKALEECRREQACLFRTTENVELSIIFVGRKRAKELNQKYRKMDYIPQVLGFPMSKEKDADGWIRLGDIVICTQKLKYEAKFQDKKIEEVLYEWLVHGVENLLKPTP